MLMPIQAESSFQSVLYNIGYNITLYSQDQNFNFFKKLKMELFNKFQYFAVLYNQVYGQR